MLKVKNTKTIEVSDWDNLVIETYGKPYSFQQQDDCQSRGMVYITIPDENFEEEEMNHFIPEVINGSVMGVKFDVWLARDPKTPFEDGRDDLDLWWDRNFYPNLQTVANDLHKKGLIEAGEYAIEIDW